MESAQTHNDDNDRKKSVQNGSTKKLSPSEKKPLGSEHLWWTLGSEHLWWTTLVAITALAFGTRFHKLELPQHVCWDETHFGKMGSWYINRTFFFDVHPPLGKMLVGLAGHLSGYDGSFGFSSPGVPYGDTPYIGLRAFCATLGATLVPLAFCISWELSRSLGASLLASCMVLFDTGLLTLSQYILLDPILMFFILAASYSMLKFHAATSFTPLWWLWLITTGILLACAISVKFVGLFVILLAGYTVVTDLWRMLGDLSMTMTTLVGHFAARAACLIALPALVYVAIFSAHFSVLNRSGGGDGFFSSAFQSQLAGNALYNTSMPRHVAYGSVVTVKNHRTAGAYLHSHGHLYPDGVGARQQQITTYAHKDDNNRWRINRPDGARTTILESATLLRSGDLVRLEHVATSRNLHSHREPAPLTRQHNQVTGYGEGGVGDSNDIFRVVVTGARPGDAVTTVRSVFRLVHLNTGCALHSHNKHLPKWGWEQLEVTCNPNTRDPKTLWNIEEVSDPRLPNTSFEVHAPGFWEKVVETHAVMTQGNQGLKPKEGEVSSRPWQWILNYKGQPFSANNPRVYLLGNPVIWWANLATLVTFGVVAVTALLIRQWLRGRTVSPDSLLLRSCGWLLLAWALHYLPFWTMTRVLYFHHYFPASLYNSMLSGIVWDALCRRLTAGRPAVWYAGTLAVVLAGLAYSFVMFSPLAYGMDVADNDYSHLRWLQSWDI